MRILILGPVTTNYVSGGVAVFDEGLCKGFRELGDEASILSIHSSSNIDNINLKIKHPKTWKVFFHFDRIAKNIKEYKPDIVISSLHYSAGIRVYKRKWKHAKYVQILHGTPCPINGKFKAWCINCIARYSRKYFDKLVTVSHLSWAINKKINRVICDEIINTGCELKSFVSNNTERKYDFCYVGRLYRDKNIEKMMDAMIELHKENPSLKVCVAGYGEQESLFLNGGKYDLDFVDFKGKIDHSDVSQIYSNSKFFISLCELEACGLAFSEAAINGCNPIASFSSGQSALFKEKKYYHEVNASKLTSLIFDLKKIYQCYRHISKNEIKELKDLFSYRNIAQRYKNLFE